jgi:predicted dehydrogenase
VAKTCLMMGASGMAGRWIQWLTEELGDRVEIVGLVEVNEEVLAEQGAKLGLRADQLFTDGMEACAKVQADFCGIATPPQFHSALAIAALDAGMPVICEKPIASTLEEAKAIAAKAKETGLPCAIIQNYRYEPNKQEVVRIRDEKRLGRLQHIVGRYACDYREHGSWGKAWRHDMDFGLLFEGSVHHFDMMRFLSGGDCEAFQGFGWNPEWSSFKHFSSGFYLMRMDNGVHAAYEGNSSAAGITSCWHKEYYRLEFEGGTVEIGAGDEVRITRVGQELEVYQAPALEHTGHEYQLQEFVDWLQGGPASATRIEDNLQSFALVIAAMETTEDGSPKRIADYLEG